jgi:hypothetical protein
MSASGGCTVSLSGRKGMLRGDRIERLSKAEHELLREVHPVVEEIQTGREEVTDAI